MVEKTFWTSHTPVSSSVILVQSPTFTDNAACALFCPAYDPHVSLATNQEEKNYRTQTWVSYFVLMNNKLISMCLCDSDVAKSLEITPQNKFFAKYLIF